MELGDRIRPVIDGIELQLAHIRREVERLESDAPDEASITTSIETSMKNLRREIEAIDEIC
jgi:phage host-nuclease inhibitor protein Gam